MKPTIREIIIVEGKHDVSAVRRAVDAVIVTTGGYRLSENRMQHIKTLSKYQDTIILTDPDRPGEHIRQTLQKYLPNTKHAYLKPAEARPSARKHRSLGIAHAKPEAILNALTDAGATFCDHNQTYSLSDIMAWQLSGCPGGATRRQRFCAMIGFEPLDAATLCQCLNACSIPAAEILKVLQQIEQE